MYRKNWDVTGVTGWDLRWIMLLFIYSVGEMRSLAIIEVNISPLRWKCWKCPVEAEIVQKNHVDNWIEFNPSLLKRVEWMVFPAAAYPAVCDLLWDRTNKWRWQQVEKELQYTYSPCFCATWLDNTFPSLGSFIWGATLPWISDYCIDIQRQHIKRAVPSNGASFWRKFNYASKRLKSTDSRAYAICMRTNATIKHIYTMHDWIEMLWFIANHSI